MSAAEPSVESPAESIYFAALAKEAPEERCAYLDRACGGDADLRRRVERLLEAQPKVGSFLQGALGAGALGAPQTAAAPQEISETAGAVIGPYKLLQQIGEGGMGVVWMAEQTEPVKRVVALKLIKAGMDSKQVIARFEAERQALALMDHAHIARVLDAGTTSTGRPYFVMDLVKGVPITKYCDEHHLTPRQRLELFIPVCHAIQHAHQKGIIHRDLKPSNVLVALYDDKPVPKVIDFGVAKATGQPLTEQTLVTGFGAIVGTLEYMSPEQAEVNQLDIDTRSDIYSLGVLLYELLTGSPPFSRKELEKAGMIEMLRVIREQEPSKPSTKLSSSDTLPTLSANRGTEPAKLTKLVRGELDWIVMKALEKDRNRRYETANGFAMDVQRYLADEAVLACPPSVGYRLRKFARRNKGGLAGAALVLFFLVLLGSVIGWAVRDRAARVAEQATHLDRAVERAELLQREGKRGEALAALERARLLAREAEPAPPMAERMASLQQLLDAEGRDEVFVARFEAIRREVQTEVDVEKNEFRRGETYPKLRKALEDYGIAVGVTPPADVVTQIQQRPAAIQTILIAALDECWGAVSPDDSGRGKWLIDVVGQADSDPWRNQVRRAWKVPATLETLALDVDVRQQPPNFLLLVAYALPIESPSRLDLARRVQFAYPGDFWANHRLGVDLYDTGKHAEAIRYYAAALSLRPDNPGVLLNRANALHEAGELEAAIVDLRRAIAVAPRYASAYNNLGLVLQDQKKLDEAIDAFHKAIEIDPQFARAYRNLGLALRDQKKPDEAVVAFRNAIKINPQYALAYHNLGLALRDQKKLDEAVVAFKTAIKINSRFGSAYHDLGITLCEQNKLDEGIDAFRRAADIDPKSATAYHDLGRALHELKKVNEAIDAYRKAIELDSTYASAYTGLGNALFDQKKLDAAIVAFRNAIKINPQDAKAYHNLGRALSEQKKLDEAVTAFTMAIKIDPQLAIACYSLGRALLGQKRLDEAIDAFRKAADVNPKYADAYVGLGVALRQQKKLDEAEKALRKAVELAPKDALAFGGLGAALAMQKKWAEAGAAFQKEVELDPTNANAYGNLGVALCHQNKLDEGIAAFRKAIELNPKLAFARQNLSNALWQKGWVQMCSPDPKRRDPKRAIETVKEAIELAPRSEMAWQCLGWVQYRLGEWRASIEALEKSCKLQKGSTGDAGQWIVLALAHAKLSSQEDLPEKQRAHHNSQARRWYDQADKQIDSWWRDRPGYDLGQAIWDFRAEARALMAAKDGKK